MKQGSESVVKMLSNSNKSYLVGAKNLGKIIADAINFNKNKVDTMTQQMQKVVVSEKTLSASNKENLIGAIYSFYDFWQKGLIVNFGGQWHVTRMVQQRDLGLVGDQVSKFGKSQVYFFGNQERESLTAEKGHIILAQPLRQVPENRCDFFDMNEETQKQIKLINFTDIVGYTGEQLMAGIISGSEREKSNLIISPASSSDYPLVDYLEALIKAERKDLEYYYAQSKSREMTGTLRDFGEQLRMTNLNYNDLSALYSHITNAILEVAEKYGPQSVGLNESFDFKGVDLLQTLVTINPTFCFFMTGPYREFSDPSYIAKILDDTGFKKKIEFYLSLIHGPGIVTKNNEGFFEIYQNRIESSQKTSQETIETCLQASELVSVITRTMLATNNHELLQSLVEACSLDKEIEKVIKN